MGGRSISKWFLAVHCTGNQRPRICRKGNGAATRGAFINRPPWRTATPSGLVRRRGSGQEIRLSKCSCAVGIIEAVLARKAQARHVFDILLECPRGDPTGRSGRDE